MESMPLAPSSFLQKAVHGKRGEKRNQPHHPKDIFAEPSECKSPHQGNDAGRTNADVRVADGLFRYPFHCRQITS
jgi:hypothetical protein